MDRGELQRNLAEKALYHTIHKELRLLAIDVLQSTAVIDIKGGR